MKKKNLLFTCLILTITFIPESLSQDLIVEGNATIGGLTNPSAPLSVKASSNADFITNGIYLFNETDAAGENAIISTRVAGGSGGDPFFSLDVSNESGWSIGMDNDDENKLKIGSRPDLIGNTKMTFQADGNIGIGITSPEEFLHIRNGNIRVDNGQYQSWGGITLQPDVDSSGDDFVSILNSFGDQSWLFVQAGDNNSWIQYHTPNNDYIGYTGVFNGVKDMDFGTGAGNTGGGVHLVIGASPKLTVDSTGLIGIGTTMPNDALDVIGDIDATGCIQTGNAGSIGGTCISDLRFKKNISTLDSQLPKIMALNPVSFDWKDDSVNRGISDDIGLIAQEVEEVIPEMVKTGEDGYKRVRYDISLQMRVIKSIQEQQEIIEEQDVTMSKQQEQINVLREEIKELKAMIKAGK